ncbi:MAG: pyruvate ferredoxin oxidoreductase [Deltaproteobacteria bacterium]|nr:pyruvate ferredoxin oxidoreductase [Deltaproteobacteria bacterium]
MDKKSVKQEELFAPGHRACHGCGMALAVRHILKATGKNIIMVTPTGCLETFTSPYGFSPWRVPWIHHLFENGPAIATGVAAALQAQGREDVRVVAIGGDGSTFDIGFGSLSGLLDRGDDVLYICVDNGAYMNTGGQLSGATPLYASSTTGPAGKVFPGKMKRKKDLPAIIAAHGIPYVATASVAYYKDLEKKVKKAMSFHGPRYIQVDTPCPSVWGFPSDRTLEVGRFGVQSGLVPLLEIEEGQITGVKKIKKTPVDVYLKSQKRYQHVFSKAGGEAILHELQAVADKNIEKYQLVKQADSGHVSADQTDD